MSMVIISTIFFPFPSPLYCFIFLLHPSVVVHMPFLSDNYQIFHRVATAPPSLHHVLFRVLKISIIIFIIIVTVIVLILVGTNELAIKC